MIDMSNVIKESNCPHLHIETRGEPGRIVTSCLDCGSQLGYEKVKNINRPAYYTRGKIETWDFIIDKGMNFLEGNIIKYVTRWRGKNGVEDLKKARVYLDKLIEEAEKE